MKPPSVHKRPSSPIYTKFLRQVQSQITKGLCDLDRMIDQQRVVMYWRLGKTIAAHLDRHHSSSAPTGFYQQLSTDLKLNLRNLQQSVQFFRAFPNPDFDLPITWSHYRCLLVLDDPERTRWLKRIIKEKISHKNFQVLLHQTIDVEPMLLSAKVQEERGALYTYRIVKVSFLDGKSEEFVVDCGFSNIIELPPGSEKIDNTRIVTSVKEKDGSYRLHLSKYTKKSIYTYRAKIQRVIDADTILANVDLGFGLWTEQSLRLRGINAPESSTIDGQRARNWLIDQLQPCSFVIIKTYKSDKYDRYLVDVFFKANEVDAATVCDQGVYLNMKMLEEGLAQSYRE